MSMSEQELHAALTAAIAEKRKAEQSGDAAATAQANIVYQAAHKAYWDFKRDFEAAAPGAMERSTAEMQVLEHTVRETLLRAAPNVLFLHSDYLPVPIAAARIFKHLGATGELYRRGSAVVELDRENRMTVVSPTALRSRLNKRGRKVIGFKKAQTATGELYFADKHCSEDQAKVLLHSSEVELLPEIKVVSAMPLLVEVGGKLVLTKPGYNSDSGVLVTGALAVGDVPLQDAAAALWDLLRDFRFATDADKARGLAALIAPALRMGGLLPGNALVDMTEADQSQTGKGFKHQVTHAIYGEQPRPVTQKDGGVGSFDESLSSAMMSGAPFIVLDNLRGKVNSTVLEHAVTPITPDGRVAVRVPHHGEVMVDVSRTLFQATSNGFSTTKDFSNRLLDTRLLKQAAEYRYTVWPEGGLLQRIRQHRAYYLSCVHAIIRYWHAAGKPMLPTEHSFREWVGTLDWMARSVWGTVALLDGHADAMARIGNEALSWLRQVALAVLQEGRGGIELRASELRPICEVSGLLPDGVRPGHDDNQAERAIGVVMASCFRDKQLVSVDGIHVTRTERMEKRAVQYDQRPVKFYTFARA